MHEYHWAPDIVDKLYLDEDDHHGILWHYNTIKQFDEDLKKKTGKK